MVWLVFIKLISSTTFQALIENMYFIQYIYLFVCNERVPGSHLSKSVSHFCIFQFILFMVCRRLLHDNSNTGSESMT